jgi:hypothetical protein
MTREQAEAMARKFLPKPSGAIAIARLADAFEAAYDDGVRDESLRWAAGQKYPRLADITTITPDMDGCVISERMTRDEFKSRFQVNPQPPKPCPIDWAFVPPISTWEFKKKP